MQRHAKKLQNKSRIHRVTEVAAGVYDVVSGESEKIYRVIVTDGTATCTCDWGKWRPLRNKKAACSHTIAVFHYRAQQEQRAAYAWHDQDRARRQHKKMQDIGDGVLITTSLRG